MPTNLPGRSSIAHSGTRRWKPAAADPRNRQGRIEPMISTTSTRLLLLAAAAVALAAGMAIFGPGGARTPDAGGTESEPAGGAVAADPAPEPQPAAGQEPPSVPPDGAPNSAAGPASSAAPAPTALTAGESGIRAANFAALL